jgi:hypothetical protein
MAISSKAETRGRCSSPYRCSDWRSSGEGAGKRAGPIGRAQPLGYDAFEASTGLEAEGCLRLRTGDIWEPGSQRVGTREMGDAVLKAL